MVKNCDIENYPSDNEDKYKTYFEKFNYPLHIFQKWAIEGIIEGQHVLVTAPTGSGKSLPAEFSLDFFVSKGKKVIYCSPIKSLSNQKFFDFSTKYTNISVGIITGDIRCNPDANVIIMTTEILLNKLYQLKSTSNISNSSTSFEMDIENELGCVIFDEIHMINDPSRGHVWENSIMMLPRHIQIVGLSATLDRPEKFALWLENRGDNLVTSEKIVYLSKKLNRTVPLIHYSFITGTGIGKVFKEKSLQDEIKQIIDKPHIIQYANGDFNDNNYKNMDKIIKLFEKNDIRVKRQHVLNKVSEHLFEKELLPAICYVFSRKQLEICANEITTNLLEFDSKIPYTIDRECEQIIRKLPNYKEYLNLPEYLDMVRLLRKGVAMHHSGLMPVLREIVEILFSKGYIKMLFATESVAIGLNLPVKTCIFTDIYKHDGNSMRILQAHEYTQAGGRAGRLGLDTVGHVIHLNNLFRDTSIISYKNMMNGKPQLLTSKFKISYNLLLNLIDNGDNNLSGFAKKSMINDDLQSKSKQILVELEESRKEFDLITNQINNFTTPKEIVELYNELQTKKNNYANKKRKEMEKEIDKIISEYKNIEQEKNILNNYYTKQTQINELYNTCKLIDNYIDNDVNKVTILLENENFINYTNESNPVLTIKGKMASQLREIHCLVFANILEDKIIDNLSSRQLITLFSCFTNISVEECVQDFTPYTDDNEIKDIICKISKMYTEYEDNESIMGIKTGSDYYIQYDLLNYVDEWCDANCIEDCRSLLFRLQEEKGIFLGEFVKALLKINNISCEMEKIAEMTGNIAFLSKLREIPNLTLKYVVTNQSLYV